MKNRFHKKYNITFILILFIFINTNGIALCQPTENSYFVTADSLYRLKDFNEAILHYKKAQNYFLENKNFIDVNKCIYQIVYSLNRQRKTQEALNYLNKYLPFIIESDLAETHDLAKSLILKAVTYKRLEDYNNALKVYEQAISIYNNNNTIHQDVAYAYKNAAQIYTRRLDYEKAILYLKIALEKDTTFRYAPSIYSHLASSYVFMENYDKVIEVVNKGLQLNQDYLEAKSNLLSWGADAWVAKNNYPKAEKQFKSAIDILIKLSNEEIGLQKLYVSLAELKTKTNQKEATENYIRKALVTAEKAFPYKNREAARMHTNIGDIYFGSKNLPQALAHYQQALIQVFPNFNSTDLSDNPSIDDIYTESWIMTASARKGEALLKRYEQGHNIADLENAAECFDLSLAGIKVLINSYGTDIGKLYLGGYSHNYFEQAIEANYLLHQTTNDLQYLEKIFSIMERSKASVLTEGIQKNRGLILADIPDSLLEAEQNLRLDLADLNKKIKTEELYEAEADQERLSALRRQTLTQQREHEGLLTSLEEKYPQFKSYTEKPLAPSLTEAQAFLSLRDETLLEYFIGEKNIYLLRVGSNSANLYQLPHDALWDNLIRGFQEYFQNSTAIINDPRGYFGAAAALYQQLFPFDSLPDNIIIVPDGDLNFVPFDALVSEQPEKPIFTQADFLLNKHRIRYAYSAGLLMASPPEMESANIFLRIAPLFANGERNLSPLANDNENIEAIPQLQSLQGKAATLAAFQKLAANCKLIQLSTHAGVDNSDFAPRIEFIDKPLYLPELYAMHIPAELVVLSACETGLGKFEKGEGVMSLARGFAYSGTSDLVASLWKVNEGSTSAIFHHFYSFLYSGKLKSEALREAKLQYLKEAKSDAKTSPYYWASFISIGIDSPMELSQGSNQLWVVVGVVLLLLIIGGGYTKLRIEN